MMIFSCGKEESGNKPSIDPVDKVTWATVVKAYPFLEGFPVFDGEVENCQYKELGSMKTLTFFDYKCDKSVSTTYYAKFIPAGFTKSEGSESTGRRRTRRITSSAAAMAAAVSA